MQIIYFPYINLRNHDEVAIPELNAVIWNFDRKANDYIPDATTRDKVKRLLAANTRGNEAIENIGVLSMGNTDFRTFSSLEVQALHEIKLLLFLSRLAKSNTKPDADRMTTAENLSFVIQNFEMDNEYIAESAGHIIRLSAAGYTIDETKFRAPGYVVFPLVFNLDSSTLKTLLEMRAKRPLIYKRILRACELFMRSYFNDPYVDDNSRILLMLAAFETLMDLPDDGQQRRHFKEIVKQFIDIKTDKQRSFFSERGNGRKVRERGSMKVRWADRLYVLRNHIIHGNTIKSSQFYFEGTQQRHIDIAVLFFVFLCHAKMTRSLKRRVFFDEIVWSEIENHDGSSSMGFTFNDHELKRDIADALRKWRSGR